MRRIYILGVVAVAGCATNAKFQDKMNNFMGAPESALVSAYGPPQSSYMSGDGSKVLQYTRSSSSQIGGATTYQPVTSTTTGTVSNGYRSANYSANTTSYQPVQQPTYTINSWCTVNFTIDSGGTVRRWSANGNNCVAK